MLILLSIEDDLEEKLGTQVHIFKRKADGGKLQLTFSLMHFGSFKFKNQKNKSNAI